MEKYKNIVAKLTGIIIGGLLMTMTISIPALAVGWAYDNVGWWYDLGNNRYPANSWHMIDGYWYFFDGSGYMATGWVESSGNWYYCEPGSGAMVTGWRQIDGKWYWFDDSGYMLIGWIESSGNWYYCDLGSGAMVTGWRQIDGIWYWFDESGAMATGWRSINGDWYYFESDGSMAYDCYIDGGWINSDGVWTKDEEYGTAEEIIDEDDYNVPLLNDEEKNQEEDNTVNSSDSNDFDYTQNDNINNGITGQDSTLSISNWMTVRDTYEVGETIPLSGVITSNYNIIEVTVSLIQGYLGTNASDVTFTPNSKSFDLSTISLNEHRVLDMKYRYIKNANYRYKVHAIDSSGKEISVETDYFYIECTNKTVIELDGYEDMEREMIEGTDYKLKGILRSNYPISWLGISLRNMKTGDYLVKEIITSGEYEYDISELFGEYSDFSKLDPGSYDMEITVNSGNEVAKTVKHKYFVINEVPVTYMFAVNCEFGVVKDGHDIVTSGSRKFTERILSDSPNRIRFNYKKSTGLKTGDSKEDFFINVIYAHSLGEVVEADTRNGSITIEHKNGMKIRYSNIDPDEMYITDVGTWVDENTMLGQIKNSRGYLKLELFDSEGNEIDIAPYLNSELPG